MSSQVEATTYAAKATASKHLCDMCDSDIGTMTITCRDALSVHQRPSPLCSHCFGFLVEKEISLAEKNPEHTGPVRMKCPFPGCSHFLPVRDLFRGLEPCNRRRLSRLCDRVQCSVCSEFGPVFRGCCQGSNICIDCAAKFAEMQMRAKDFVVCPGGCQQALTLDTLTKLVSMETITGFLQRRATRFQSRLLSIKTESSPTRDLVATTCRHCPRCKVLIEKNQGCNDMACRCGIHFCFGCSRPHALCACASGHGATAFQADDFVYCWWCNQTSHVEAKCPALMKLGKNFLLKRHQHRGREHRETKAVAAAARPATAAAVRPATAAATRPATTTPSSRRGAAPSSAVVVAAKPSLDEDGWSIVAPRRPRLARV